MYVKVNNYSMKCRLYPNKEQAKIIDDQIYGVQLYLNKCMYNLFNYFDGTTEKKDKDGKTVHWINSKTFGMFTSAAYKANCIAADSRIGLAIPASLTTEIGAIKTDFKKRLLMAETVWEKAERIKTKSEGKKYKKQKKIVTDIKRATIKYPVESIIPNYYTKEKSRKSFTYATCLSSVSKTGNDNVFFIQLVKPRAEKRVFQPVKVRGWNKNIRFGENCSKTFLEWVLENKTKKITITVSKDHENNYWIIFKIPECYVKTKEKVGNQIGIDVGIKDLIITSNGVKYPNKKYKYNKQNELKRIDKRLSRRLGWRNIKFREGYKAGRFEKPSKRYLKTQMLSAKINRKIANKRNLWNNIVSKDIVINNDYIAVETLNISGMFRNKHLSKALEDASMGDVLAKIKYKSIWHDRIVIAIDRWSPSSKRCNCCGYIKRDLKLRTREWICPVCRTQHDRDINAARNILYYSMNLN